MIRVLIIDDEPFARQGVLNLLAKYPDFETIGECRDGAEAAAAIRELKPELVFLDVQMPAMSGFDVLRELQPAETPLVIFVTAYDEYTLQAFEVSALDYLLKPINPARFDAALKKARANLERSTARELAEKLHLLLARIEARATFLERVAIKTNGRIILVQTAEIDWIEAADNYVRLFVRGRSLMHHETLSNLESKLDPQKFLRVHRSKIVNLEKVREIQPMFRGKFNLILRDGTSVSTGSIYRERVSRIFDI